MTDMIAITGNTYPVKDELKRLGARWDAAAKVWMVPVAKAAEARFVVEQQPAKRRGPTDCWVAPTARNRSARQRRIDEFNREEGWAG